MKRNHLLFLSIAMLLFFSSYSQVNVSTLGFGFSALVRDTAGRVQPLKNVTLKFTLLLGQNGTPANSAYIETQNTNTDAYGFVNVTIGTGTKVKGTFSKVDFSVTNYWILIEVLNTFTNSYEPLAKQAFQAVPYAKVAGSLSGGAVIPAGTIMAFGGDKEHIPSGWLLCDGQELDNTVPAYQPLFNTIQYNWGTSNHANKFNIPNTSGLFLRGANNGFGNDPDALNRNFSATGSNAGDNVGSKQDDENKSHSHHLNIPPGNFVIAAYPGMGIQANQGQEAQYVQLNGITSANSGGNESRPKNIYVNYIIKL